jgi:L-lysine exporter family protein LysE/ArgO
MTSFLSPATAGFVLGGSLIIAIGAQNAFILRMGLMRQHVFILCLVCALSDAVLIAIGVSGLGAFVDTNPALLKLISIGGGLFLMIYAFLALGRAIRPQTMKPAANISQSLAKSLGICLAFTFLNPHVYLDTVVLIGALAAVWPSEQRVVFALGAMGASFVWFFGLGYGARLLKPMFEKQIAWRILDVTIAIVMAWLGISLLLDVIS